ncbi:MAG: hypothetical protein IT381_24205 [Deltaproteobacteria bacterium]|nr:hypothetical protein [Deltaproteobacteria bacterium]
MAAPARPKTADKPSAVAPPAEVSKDFDPIKLLRSVESGDVEMTLPGNPGTYGSGTDSFTVQEGTKVVIRAKVRDGRLVPGLTEVKFIAAEDPTNTIPRPLDNVLWITTTKFELTADGQLIARVNGWSDQVITNSLLALDKMKPPRKSLPLDMEGLYDTITTGAAIMAEQAKKFTAGKTGPPFDVDAYRLKLTNCVIAPGPFPLPDPSIKVNIGGKRPPEQLLARKIHDAGQRGDWAALERYSKEALALAKTHAILPPEVLTLVEETIPEALKKASAANDYKWWHILLLILAALACLALIAIGAACPVVWPLALVGAGGLIAEAIGLVHDAATDNDHERAKKALDELQKVIAKEKAAPEDLSKRTVVTMTATPTHMHIDGQFRLNSIEIDRPELVLKAGATTTTGVVDVAMQKKKVGEEWVREVKKIDVTLNDVEAIVNEGSFSDGKGTTIALRDSYLGHSEDGEKKSHVKLSFDALKGAPIGTPEVKVGRVKGDLDPSTIMIPTPTGETPLKIERALIDGEVTLDAAGKMAVDVKTSDVQANVDGISTGDGAFRVGYSTATITGGGNLRYRDGEASFTGDLHLTGTVADGGVGQKGGMFHADIATGANVTLDLTSLNFGKAGVDFKGKGALDVALDSGSILLTTGTRLTVSKGARAKVEVSEVIRDENGTRFKGRVELDATIGANVDPKLLTGPGVKITKLSGAGGKVHIVLEDVTVAPDESEKYKDVPMAARPHIVKIAGLESDVKVKIVRIEGKLDLASMPSLPGSKASTKIAPAAAKPAPKEIDDIRKAKAIVPPAPEDILKKIDSGDIDLWIPIKKGTKLGDYEFPNSTYMHFVCPVRGGNISYSKTKITFSPVLDETLWVDGKGIYLESDGTMKIDLDWWPDKNLSEAIQKAAKPPLAKPVKVPSNIVDIFKMAMSIGGLGSGTPAAAPSFSLDTLAKLGVTANIKNVKLDGSPIALGGTSSVTIDSSSTIDIVVDSVGTQGRITAIGDVKVNDATITAENAMVDGLKTTVDARLGFQIFGDGAAQEMIVGIVGKGKFDAKRAVFAPPAGYIDVTSPTLEGSFVLTTKGGGKPSIKTTLSSFSGTLAPSQMVVTKAGVAVPVDIGGGAVNGDLKYDDKTGALKVNAYLKGADVETGGGDLGMTGFNLQTGKVTAKAGAAKLTIDIDPSAKKSSMRLNGDVRLSTSIAKGSFGSAKTPIAFEIGSGSKAEMVVAEMEFGDVALPTDTIIAGNTLPDGTPAGKLTLALASGNLVLPSGIQLNIVPGTEGNFEVSSYKRAQGDAFATVKGKMTLRARTSTYVPKGGLQVAAGVRLLRVEGSKGEVLVVIDSFELAPDGAFALNGTTVTANVKANIVEAQVDAPKLVGPKVIGKSK